MPGYSRPVASRAWQANQAPQIKLKSLNISWLFMMKYVLWNRLLFFCKGRFYIYPSWHKTIHGLYYKWRITFKVLTKCKYLAHFLLIAFPNHVTMFRQWSGIHYVCLNSSNDEYLTYLSKFFSLQFYQGFLLSIQFTGLIHQCTWILQKITKQNIIHSLLQVT